MAAFYPQRTQQAQPVSSGQAQAWLSTYLQSSEAAAFLQPDALLTASGPVRTQGMSSVTIHNLKRLQAGLNGKYDVHELDQELDVKLKESDDNFKGAIVNFDALQGGEEDEEDWQNKSEYEREQDVETGEVADRDHAHGVAKELPASTKTSTGTNEFMDKAARKKAKKERKLMQRAKQLEETAGD